MQHFNLFKPFAAAVQSLLPRCQLIVVWTLLGNIWSSNKQMKTENSTNKSCDGGRGWREILTVNRKLLPLKLFLLLHYGGFSALYPYLAIHIKSVGITVTQAGLIFGLYPICNCLGGPIAGVLGDKTGRFKVILILMHGLSILFHLLLLFAVPVYRTTDYPFEGQFNEIQAQYTCHPASLSTQLTLQSETAAGVQVVHGDCDAVSGIPASVYRLKQCVVNCSGLLSTRDCSDDGCTLLHELFRQFQVTPTALNGTSNLQQEMAFGNDCQAQKNCSIICNIEGTFLLPCHERKTEGVQLVTFGVYTAIRMLCGLTINVAFAIMDASIIQMVEDFKGDVGINRAYILVGYITMPPLSGYLIDVFSQGKTQTDYSPAFYIFGICMALAALMLLVTDLRVRKPAKNLLKNASKLLVYPRVVAFLIIYGFIGMGWGFLETFLFWFLDKDLNAPKWFLGLTNTVGGLAGLPFAFCATWIIQKTGYSNVFVFGLFIFGLRFVGYSLVDDYWWVLPLEAMEAFTSTLPVTAATVYASTFSAELLVTLQGIITAVHYGIGRGVGSLMGGFMIKDYGSRESFRIIAYICLIYAVLHFVVHYFYLRRLSRPTKVIPGIETEVAHEKDESDTAISISESHRRKSSILPEIMLHDLQGWGSHQALDCQSFVTPVQTGRSGDKLTDVLLIHRRKSHSDNF